MYILGNIKKESKYLIERYVKSDLYDNTKISCRENFDIVVLCNGTIRRVKTIEDNIVNPSSRFSLFPRKDKNKYVFYLVDKLHHEGKYGTNVHYYTKDGTEKRVNIRCSFIFQIYRAEKVIPLLSDGSNNYTKKFFEEKIRQLISCTVKKIILNNLQKEGIQKVLERLYEISDIVLDSINKEVLYNYGVRIIKLDLIVEECDFL